MFDDSKSSQLNQHFLLMPIVIALAFLPVASSQAKSTNKTPHVKSNKAKFGKEKRLSLIRQYRCLDDDAQNILDEVEPDYNEAFDKLLQSLKIKEKLYGAHHSETRKTCLMMGKCFDRQHEHKEAIYYYQRSLGYLIGKKNINSPQELHELRLLGQAYRQAGQLKAAEITQRHLIDCLQSIPNASGSALSNAWIDLGDTYANLNKNSEAISCYLESVQAGRKSNSAVHTHIPLDRLAKCYEKENDNDNAEKYYKQFLQETSSPLYKYAPQVFSLTKIQVEKKKYSDAICTYKLYLESCLKHKSQNGAVEGTQNLQNLINNPGKYKLSSDEQKAFKGMAQAYIQNGEESLGQTMLQNIALIKDPKI